MKYFLNFPADTAVLEQIGNIITMMCRKAGFGETDIYDIQLAIDEACTNTIIHGLRKDPNKNFQLIIESNKGEIEIMIHEKGDFFSLKEIPMPDLDAPLEKRSEGGLGIFLLRKLMDKVEFNLNENGVKTLYLAKKSRINESA